MFSQAGKCGLRQKALHIPAQPDGLPVVVLQDRSLRLHPADRGVAAAKGVRCAENFTVMRCSSHKASCPMNKPAPATLAAISLHENPQPADVPSRSPHRKGRSTPSSRRPKWTPLGRAATVPKHAMPPAAQGVSAEEVTRLVHLQPFTRIIERMERRPVILRIPCLRSTAQCYRPFPLQRPRRHATDG
jgi:hypothetical protein